MGYRVFRLELFFTVHCEKNLYISFLYRLGLKLYWNHLWKWLKKWLKKKNNNIISRVQRKSFLQLDIRASWTFTSPIIISTSPKNVLMSRLTSQFFCNLNSSKNFTCPLGKLITGFTSPIAKSSSPGVSDTTLFACWLGKQNRNEIAWIIQYIIIIIYIELYNYTWIIYKLQLPHLNHNLL